MAVFHGSVNVTIFVNSKKEMTTIVNIKYENCDEKICRGTIFGNPYIIGIDGDRYEVIKRYKTWFNLMIRDPRFKREVLKLRGKKLGCFCKMPGREIICHGDVIVDYLENNC